MTDEDAKKRLLPPEKAREIDHQLRGQLAAATRGVSPVDVAAAVVTQREASQDEPTLEDLHDVGTIVRVLRVVDARREGKQALVVGVARARVGDVLAEEPCFRVSYTAMDEYPTEAIDEPVRQRGDA